jgi:hypothetical protein
MKIHQIPNGTRFEYEGEEYVKTGPLFAAGKGGQRLIPKYAVLRVLGDVEPVHVAAMAKSIAVDDVELAFEQFYADCKTWVPGSQESALAAARQRFLAAVGIAVENKK